MGDVQRPAELLKNLDYDINKMDTKLAEDYIIKYNSEFQSSKPSTSYVLDGYNNKIYLSYKTELLDELIIQQDPRILKKIAYNIQNNADLFAQLEYLIRQIPQEEVKKYDIQLLMERFLYYSSQEVEQNEVYGEQIVLVRDTPLCVLGFVAEQLALGKIVTVNATKDVAVVTHLFRNLCILSGIDEKRMIVRFFDEEDILNGDKIFIRSSGRFLSTVLLKKFSCVAVVAECADIYSAISGILTASTNRVYPWSLRHIFIQESVYDSFKQVLKQKGELFGGKSKKCDEEIKHLGEMASSVTVSNGKTVVFDYVGNTENINTTAPVIFVQAYRTTKELLSLLKRYAPLYLSLWSSDISITNEITFNCDVPNIWINTYGVLSGPKIIGQTFYEGYDFERISVTTKNTTVHALNDIRNKVEVLTKIWTNWKKYSIKERINNIVKVLEKCKDCIFKDKEMYSEIKGSEMLIQNFRPNSFVFVDGSQLCYGKCESIGTIAFVNKLALTNKYKDILFSVILGNGILLETQEEDEFIQALMQQGIPILSYTNLNVDQTDLYAFFVKHHNINLVAWSYEFSKNIMYKPKTIWSNFGETFAN